MTSEPGNNTRKGYEAWLQGDIDGAVRILEAARSRRPASLDALLPLARALSERGDLVEALAVVEEAIRIESASAGRLYRAMILHDHGRGEDARADLVHLARGNILAGALIACLDLRTRKGAGGEVCLPCGSRWIADVAGRLLAILEGWFFLKDAEEAIRYHHGVLLSEGSKRSTPLEAALAARRYAEVVELGAKDANRNAPADIPVGLALIALGRDGEAARRLREAARRSPGSPDAHFLEGLGHARFGRPGEAGWSFSRAARRADIEVDEILREVARRVEVGIVEE